MKNVLLLIGFWGICNLCFAQTNKPGDDIIVNSKKVYLNYKGQKDSLFFPVVSEKYQALKEALSPDNLLQGDNLDTVIARYGRCGCGIKALSYSVTFANADIMSLELYYEGMDDHPTSHVEWLTLNVHTGKPYPVDNEINQAGIDYVTARYKKWLKQNIDDEKTLKEDEDAQKDVYGDLANATETLTPKIITGDYIFADKGAFFKTDAILPQEAQDHEPNRVLLIPYSQLKAYIKAGSLVLKSR